MSTACVRRPATCIGSGGDARVEDHGAAGNTEGLWGSTVMFSLCALVLGVGAHRCELSDTLGIVHVVHHAFVRVLCIYKCRFDERAPTAESERCVHDTGRLRRMIASEQQW